jgi:uncharacterized membrane protein YphA (DoxX/SURF4 family)
MTPRQAAGLAARVIVGAVLIYAGATKAAAPAEEFALVIQSYSVVPLEVALPMAGLLPWLEMLVGWALLLGVETSGAAAVAGAMFAMFLLALGSVVARGIPIPNCGCFGDSMHFTPVQALLFDSVMGALSWTAFRFGAGPASLDGWSQRGL